MGGPMQLRFQKNLLSVVSIISMVSSLAFGWGSAGHEITARIAEYYLTPITAKNLRAVLAKDLSPREEAYNFHHSSLPIEAQAKNMPPIIAPSFISSWADHLRPQRGHQNPLWNLTKIWHYINIPMEAQEMAVDPYCSSPGDNCIVKRLISLTAALKERDFHYSVSGVPIEKNEAVKFVVHFYGDLSQPLHNNENDKDQDGNAVQGQDRGGNSRKVDFFGETTIKYPDGEKPLSLHSVWDDKMIEKAMHRPAKRVYAYSEALHKKITPRQIESWKNGDVEKWSWEAHELAKLAYEGINLDFDAVSVLSQKYYERAMPIVESQLQKGGYTLAMALNQIFDPESR